MQRRPLNFIELLQSDDQIRANLNLNCVRGSLFSRVFNDIKISTGALTKLSQTFIRSYNKDEIDTWYSTVFAVISDDLLNSKGLLKSEIINELEQIVGREKWLKITAEMSLPEITQAVTESYVLEFIAGDVSASVGSEYRDTQKLSSIELETRKRMADQYKKIFNSLKAGGRRHCVGLIDGFTLATDDKEKQECIDRYINPKIEYMEMTDPAEDADFFNVFNFGYKFEIFDEVYEKLLAARKDFVASLEGTNRILMQRQRKEFEPKSKELLDVINDHLKKVDPNTALPFRSVSALNTTTDLTPPNQRTTAQVEQIKEAAEEAKLFQEQRLKKIQDDYARSSLEARHRLESSENEKKALKEALELTIEKVKRLAVNLDRANEIHSEVTRKLESTEKELKGVKQTLEIEKDRGQTLAGTLDIEKERTSSQARVYEELVKKNQAHELALGKLQIDFDAQSKALELAQNANAASKEEIEILKQSIVKLNAEIERLNTLVSQGIAEIEKLNTLVSEGRAEIEKLNTVVSQGIAEIERLNTLVSQGIAEIEKLNTLVSQERAEIEKLNGEKERNTIQHEQQVRELKQEISTLTTTADTKIAGLQLENESLNNSLADSNAENVRLSNLIKSSNEDSKQQLLHSEDTRKLLENSNERLRAMLRDETTAKETIGAAKDAEIAQKNTQIAQLTQDLNAETTRANVAAEKMAQKSENTRPLPIPAINGIAPPVSNEVIYPVCLEIYEYRTKNAIDALTSWKDHLRRDISREVPQLPNVGGVPGETDVDYDARLANPQTRLRPNLSYSTLVALKKYEVCQNLIKSVSVQPLEPRPVGPETEEALQTRLDKSKQKIEEYTSRINIAKAYFEKNEETLNETRTHWALRALYVLFSPLTLLPSIFYNPGNPSFLNNVSKQNKQTKVSLNGLFGDKNAISSGKLGTKTQEQLTNIKNVYQEAQRQRRR